MTFPFYFKNPDFLRLLFLLVPLIGLLWLGGRRRSKLLERFGSTELLRVFSHFPTGRTRFLSAATLCLVFALLVLALARPVLPGQHVRIKEGTMDLVVVLDVSKSMAAEDYPDSTSRLQEAKEVIRDVLKTLPGNRVGLVTFAREGFSQAELTGDFVALQFVLKYWVNIESAPGGGTRFRPALDQALALFDRQPRRKVILFLSDGGEESAAQVEPLAAEAKARGVKIISLGFGRPEGSPIPIYDDRGKFKDWITYGGKVVLTSLNEPPLLALARGTGGVYRRVTAGFEIAPLFRDRRVVKSDLVEGELELYQYPLGFGLLLLWWNRYSQDP